MKTKKINQKVNKLLSKIRDVDRNKWTINVSLILLLIDITSFLVGCFNFFKFAEWGAENPKKIFDGPMPAYVEHYLTSFSGSFFTTFCTTIILLIILWNSMRKHTKKRR